MLGELLSIAQEAVDASIAAQFRGKKTAISLNQRAVRIGARYVREHLRKRDPHVVAPMDRNEGKILIDGNAAAALGAMFGGGSVATWYPITPSSSLVEQLQKFLRRHRREEDGKATFAVVQAEDELAAVGLPPDGRARGPSPRRRAPGSRSCPSSSGSATTPRSRW